MPLKAVEGLRSFEGVTKEFEWIYNNFGFNNLRGSGIKTSAPTVDQLDKGQTVISEVSGVPYFYYKTLNGILYRIPMTAV